MYKSIIKDYIKKDRVSYIHIEELLNRDYSIEYVSSNGFIIVDKMVDFTYISFSDFKEMSDVLSNKRYDNYIAYDKEIVDFYGDNDKVIVLNQLLYESRKKFDIDGYDLRVLDESYIDIVDSNYKAIGPNESNLDRLKAKEVIGLFENDELAGFIGRHPEGCIGMLLVFEKYRNKGYASVLEKAKMNDLIDRGQLVFNEVVDGNDISMKIQRKLGYSFGKKKLYWLINE